MDSPNLKKSIRQRNWEETSRILKDYPHSAKEELSTNEFTILWSYAPLVVIQALLRAWPQAYNITNYYGESLVEAKSAAKQWDFLDNLFQEFPQFFETKCARTVAMNGASLEFLNRHWKERGALLFSVHNHNWDESSRILKDHPELAKDQLSKDEFHILWKDAPFDTIQALLESWPEAYEQLNYSDRNLVTVKSFEKQWDFLKSLIQSFPIVVTAEDVKYACRSYTRLDVFELMLDKKPNTPLEDPYMTLYLIENYKFEHFRVVLSRCPATTKLMDDFLHLPLLLLMFQKKERMNADWIGPILGANPMAARQKDCDGKTALHLAYQHGASSEIIEMLLQAYPEAENERDNPGRFPKDLEHQSKKTVFTPANEALVLRDNSSAKKRAYLDNAVVACPDDTLIRDPQGAQTIEETDSDFLLIDMPRKVYPEVGNERDKLGRLPKDLANRSDDSVFTPPNETFVLVNEVAVIQSDKLSAGKKTYPDDAVVVCRGDMLIRDPQTAENEEDKKTYENYSKQVVAQELIFETLLEEFSKMVGVDNKDVIQKAAALQALAVRYLSNQNNSIINFGTFENPCYWFQKEMLKLVMRVYNETQSEVDSVFPSIGCGEDFCVRQLERRKNGKPSPKPNNKHVRAFKHLTRWLTEGFDDSSSYSVQGPVLKPLQSLFNKVFIRGGQTSLHVIGDVVRGTLLLDNTAVFDEVVKRIENTFPNITEDKIRHPDSFNGLTGFLTYVHDGLKYLPGSNNNVLPYRFKANSSQQEKEKPLWYNFNFFLQVPEYHRVGFSEMFVACEMQIGLADEISKHRSIHVAYERDRILSNQPLLKNYDTMIKEEEDEDIVSQISNCTEEDNKLIEKVMFGKIASEVLVPCTTAGNDNKNNILLFEKRLRFMAEVEADPFWQMRSGLFHPSRPPFRADPFRLSRRAGYTRKPKRLCLNNRSLNWLTVNGGKGYSLKAIGDARVVAGPYKLNETKRYFVESFVLKNIHYETFVGMMVGLYAHVGPYSIQITCGAITPATKEIVFVKSGQNFSYPEQTCPVPAGTTALEVIIYGKSSTQKFGFDMKMSMSLKVFDVY